MKGKAAARLTLAQQLRLQQKTIDRQATQSWQLLSELEHAMKGLEWAGQTLDRLRPGVEAQRVLDGLVPMVQELIDSVPENEQPELLNLARRIGDHLGID